MSGSEKFWTAFLLFFAIHGMVFLVRDYMGLPISKYLEIMLAVGIIPNIITALFCVFFIVSGVGYLIDEKINPWLDKRL